MTARPQLRTPRATLASVAIVGALSVAGCAGVGGDDSSTASTTTGVRVVKIVDGDTLNVKINDTPQRIRAALDDSPEKSSTRYGAPECGGQQATEAFRRLIAGRRVTLRRPSTEDRDHYGRLIREILADGRSVDEELVREGWAKQFVVPAGGGGAAANRRIARAAADARQHRRGIWKVCGGFNRPQ